MKNLIKFLIAAVMFAMATESFAQTFGVKGGLNLSTAVIKDNDDTYDDDLKMKPGFNLGATVEFPINETFSVATGLLLSNKGTKEEYSESDYHFKEVLSLYYFDIPITGKATYDLGGTKIYGIFGPCIGVGLSGKWKTEETFNGETDTQTETLQWGSDSENDHLKRLDFGLLFGGGVEISSFQIELSYNLGLANISSYTGDGFKINSRVLALSLGYKFGGK